MFIFHKKNIWTCGLLQMLQTILYLHNMRYRTSPMTQTREKWPKIWQPQILALFWTKNGLKILFYFLNNFFYEIKTFLGHFRSKIRLKLGGCQLLDHFSRDWVLGSVRYRILCQYKVFRSIHKRPQVPEKIHFCIISIIRRKNVSKLEKSGLEVEESIFYV